MTASVDPRYVAARRVLLDALDALASQRRAVVVAGAQAVYLRTGDGEMLHDYFTRTRAIRRGIIEAGQDTEAPDFGRGKSR